MGVECSIHSAQAGCVPQYNASLCLSSPAVDALLQCFPIGLCLSAKFGQYSEQANCALEEPARLQASRPVC